MRPSKLTLMLRIAQLVSERSTCERAKVGAIITDLDMTTIYAFGYNGAARGLPNGCERDEPGNCSCVHAECNALIKAPYSSSQYGSLLLFCTTTPCETCAKLIMNSNVAQVFALKEYRLSAGIEYLDRVSIPVFIPNDRGDFERC